MPVFDFRLEDPDSDEFRVGGVNAESEEEARATLARQEQSGLPITDAQRQTLEQLQSRIVSHIKVKALNLAEVDFMDLMRKVSQTWQRPLADAAGASAGAGPKIAR